MALQKLTEPQARLMVRRGVLPAKVYQQVKSGADIQYEIKGGSTSPRLSRLVVEGQEQQVSGQPPERKPAPRGQQYLGRGTTFQRKAYSSGPPRTIQRYTSPPREKESISKTGVYGEEVERPPPTTTERTQETKIYGTVTAARHQSWLERTFGYPKRLQQKAIGEKGFTRVKYEVSAAALGFGVGFTKTLLAPHILIGQVIQSKSLTPVKETGKWIKQVFTDRQYWYKVGEYIKTPAGFGEAAGTLTGLKAQPTITKFQKVTFQRGLAKVSKTYTPIEQTGIRYSTTSGRLPSKTLIQQVPKKQRTTIHVTTSKAFEQKLTKVESFPSQAKGLRKKYEFFPLFKSVTLQKKPVAYVGFAGLGDVASAETKVVFGKPTVRVHIFSKEKIQPVTSSELRMQPKQLFEYQKKQTGKTLISAETILGKTEAEVITPAGSKIQKVRDIGWTYYKTKRPLPKFIETSPTLKKGIETLGLDISEMRRIKLIESKVVSEKGRGKIRTEPLKQAELIRAKQVFKESRTPRRYVTPFEIARVPLVSRKPSISKVSSSSVLSQVFGPSKAISSIKTASKVKSIAKVSKSTPYSIISSTSTSSYSVSKSYLAISSSMPFVLRTSKTVTNPLTTIRTKALVKKKKKGDKRLARVFKYKPSIVAVETLLKGKKPTVITGLEQRPIN